MNFWYKTRGAVSIFLVIILIPMMTVSALFVDAGKVRLGKGVAVSAGDLALNTALTDYDTQLKDLYGLFATAQNTEELFAMLEDYYRTCIVSAGVSDEDAQTYVEQIMAQLGMVAEDDDTADILNIQLADFEVQKHKDASLANATLVEKQIVEFMKYRGPINTGMSFLSSLKSFTTLSKQTDLVNKRTQYYETQQSVMEKLKLAWDEIAAYNALDIRKDGYLEEMQAKFQTQPGTPPTGWKADYQFIIHNTTVTDLYETQSHSIYECEIDRQDRDVKDAEGNVSQERIWTFRYLLPELFDSNWHTEEDFTKYYSYYKKDKLPTEGDLTTKITTFYGHLNEYEDWKAELAKYKGETAPSERYDLQYYIQAIRRGNLLNYTSSLRQLYADYQRLKGAMIWLDAYDEDERSEIENKQLTINGKTMTLSAFWADIGAKYEAAMDENSVARGTGVAEFTAKSRALRNLTNPMGTRRFDSLGKSANVEDTAAAIGAEAGNYAKTIESGRDHILEANRLLGEAKAMIEGDLATAESNWKSAASDSEIKDTALAKQDSAEIAELGKYLNGGDVQKLIDRLNSLSGDLSATAEQIRNYKYQDKFIGDITSYADVAAALEKKIGDSTLKMIPVRRGEMSTKATEWFSWQNGNLDVSWAKKQGHEPNLAVDKLKFYSYLYTHFSTADSTASLDASKGSAEEASADKEDTTNGRDLFDKIKETGSSASAGTASQSENTSGYQKANNIAGDDLPSAGKSGSGAKSADLPDAKEENTKTLSNTSASLDGMFSELGKALNGFGTDLRDKLFVSDYVLSMFSYNTIEQELEDKKAKGIVQDATPYTLTWVNIGAENNFAYGYEVEYAIYGGTNASNVAKAYGSIYAIRLGFNLIYAFTDTEIRETALGIAVPISAATLGIIPVPLIQAAIIIGVSLCESALDLAQLRNGEAVPLFKNKQTWKCSASGLLNAAGSEIKQAVGEEIKTYVNKGFDYADGEISKLLDATDEELDRMIQSGSDKIEENVGAAYDDMITRHAETAIQQLTTLANQAIEEKAITPATNTTAYVSEGLDRWLAQQRSSTGADSLAYAAEEKAVEIIKSQYIGSVVSILEEGKGKVGDTINSYGDEVMSQIKGIRDQITNQVKSGRDKISQYKDDMIGKVKDSASEGIDSLRTTLNDQIDGVFGSGGGLSSSADGTGMASLISFRYSDYLRLFLMIGLYTNEEGVVLRTADMIQKNMAMKNKGFLMSNAAVYVDLSATVQVKPTLLAVPLLADVENNPAGKAGWYTIHVDDVRGY